MTIVTREELQRWCEQVWLDCTPVPGLHSLLSVGRSAGLMTLPSAACSQLQEHLVETAWKPPHFRKLDRADAWTWMRTCCHRHGELIDVVCQSLFLHSFLGEHRDCACTLAYGRGPQVALVYDRSSYDVVRASGKAGRDILNYVGPYKRVIQAWPEAVDNDCRVESRAGALGLRAGIVDKVSKPKVKRLDRSMLRGGIGG